MCQVKRDISPEISQYIISHNLKYNNVGGVGIEDIFGKISEEFES